MQRANNATRRAAAARLARVTLGSTTVAPVAQFVRPCGDVTMPDFTLAMYAPGKDWSKLDKTEFRPADGRYALRGVRLTSINHVTR